MKVNKYKWLNISGLLIPTLCIFTSFPVVLDVSLFVIYLIAAGSLLGQFFENKKISQILLGVLLSLVSTTIILSVIYWLFQVNGLIVAVSYFLTPFVGYYLLKFFFDKKQVEAKTFCSLTKKFNNFSPKKEHLFLLINIGAYLSLFYWVIQIRTGIDLSSPWSQTGELFLLAFSGAAMLLLFSLKENFSKIIKALLMVLHYGLFFSIAWIVYQHGFGFDPFIHQASEKWIIEHGAIQPKKPFYLGQYMLVVGWQLITGLPVDLIDSILVPLLAGSLLPLWLIWGDTDKNCWWPIAFLPVVMISFLIVTTPNNLALLFALLVIFLIWHNKDSQNIKIFLINLILVGFILVTHPLIGIPIAIYFIGTFWQEKTEYSLTKIFTSGAIISTAVPAVLLSFLLWTGRGGVLNPMINLDSFLTIFSQPSWYQYWQAPIEWQAVYLYKFVLPALVITTGLMQIIKKNWGNKKRILFEFVMLAGVIISAFLIASGIEVKNVISLEKNSYADRTIALAYVLLLPYFYSATKDIFNYVKNKDFLIETVTVGVCSLTLSLSMYFTYPTYDPVSLNPGHSVRDEDMQAVRLIDELNTNKDYIVLTNQMVGAAALDQFGFTKYHKLDNGESHYFYSIPAGGKLYEYFGEIVYNSTERKWIRQAMDQASVDKAYFVHTNYWYPAIKLKNELVEISDYYWKVGEDGEAWVFEFNR
jgi:hypothetical protein